MLNLLHLLEKIKTVTSAILDNLEKRGSKRPKALRAYAWKKFGAENVEKCVYELELDRGLRFEYLILCLIGNF